MFTYAFSLSISKTKDDLKFQTSTRSWKIFKEPELPGPWKVPTAGLSSHTAVWAPGARGFSLATASLSLQEWLLPQHLCWALEPRLQPSPRWQVLPSKHPHFLVAHCSHHCQPSQPTPCPSCWPGSQESGPGVGRKDDRILTHNSALHTLLSPGRVSGVQRWVLSYSGKLLCRDGRDCSF